MKKLKELKISEGPTAKLGTPYLVNIINELGMMPTRNFQLGTFQKASIISGEYLRDTHLIEERVCSKCLIPCEKITVTRNGRIPETRVRGPEYESIWALGPQCGNSDMNSIIVCARTCDEIEVDTISTGVTIGFAMELFERGILNEKDLGTDLRFGNSQGMERIIRDIGDAQGIGKVLGKGVKRAAEEISNGSERYAMHVKGMEIPGYDPRGAVGMGTGLRNLSPRGMPSEGMDVNEGGCGKGRDTVCL